MRIGSLFSGIGGLELGLEWSGLGRTVWQCEQDPYCQQVLARHWPGLEIHGDIRQIGRHNLAPVDVLCGGFPCQDVSGAGKGAGLAGSRSGLWFEFARVIDEIGPEWVVIENVTSGARRWVDAICAHLGQLGYEALPVPLSAEDVGAPHRRARIFVIAHGGSDVADAHGSRRGTRRWMGPPRPAFEREGRWAAEPDVGRVAHGVPSGVDRIKGLGNAVVPQCAEVIGHMILELKKVLDES